MMIAGPVEKKADTTEESTNTPTKEGDQLSANLRVTTEENATRNNDPGNASRGKETQTRLEEAYKPQRIAPKKPESTNNKAKETTQHNVLSWIGCYDDSCLVHLSDKEGAGYFPRKPSLRRKATFVTRDDHLDVGARMDAYDQNNAFAMMSEEIEKE